MLTLAFNIQPVRAGGTIYIRADGSIDPQIAPISSVDNVTYTFTGNINDSIVVQKDDVEVDGVGYTLQGTGSGVGIDLSWRINVTIKNVEIKAFEYGIVLQHSSANDISGNNITASGQYGIFLGRSSNNSVTANFVDGVCLVYSLNCIIAGNEITLNRYGTYLENSSSNTIVGNNITANEYGVWLWYSSSNTVNGNKIESSDQHGICLVYSANNDISGNNITANEDGMWLEQSPYNSINENSITSNRWYGIHLLWYSSNNSITGNSVTTNKYGIFVYSSLDNSIAENIIASNWFGITLLDSSNSFMVRNLFTDDGLYVSNSYQNKVEENFVNGKPLVYLESVSDYAVSDAGQIVLIDCNNILVENVNLSSTTIGLELWGTKNSKIQNNSITANTYSGIFLLSESSNNTIVGNNIADNLYGIELLESSNNSVYHNNFVNNRKHFYTYGARAVNAWDNGYPSGGNYWSDYTGMDLFSGPFQNETGSDGIGDTHYTVDADNTDGYPLMIPWGSLLGDVNGDGYVGIDDIYLVASRFGREAGEPEYNRVYDLNGDGYIGIDDIFAVAKRFGQEENP
jgi:parallel beta-helix repeat protein